MLNALGGGADYKLRQGSTSCWILALHCELTLALNNFFLMFNKHVCNLTVSCDGNFSNTTTTNMTSVLRDSLPSNSICTLRVRARSDGDDVVYSDFSDAVIFTTCKSYCNIKKHCFFWYIQ